MRIPHLFVPALLALLGCVDFEMPVRPSADEKRQALGTACAQAAQCDSDTCLDGVCCERACGETESCSVAGREGLCTVRSLGDGCGRDAQCPSGFCTDGVCCESACHRDGGAACYSCRNPGAAGSCQPAADYTDPRAECAGDCLSCFAGMCVPAPVGDAGKCADGLVCSADGACRSGRGAPCLEAGLSTDALCASGQCVAGTCAALETQRIELPFSSPSHARRGIVAAAATGAAGAVLFWERQQLESVAPTHNDLYLALDVGRGWQVTRLERDLDRAAGEFPSAVGFIGSAAYLARYLPWVGWDCLQPSGKCGLTGQLHLPNGQAGGLELIDGDVTVSWVGLARDLAGTLHAVYVARLWEGETSRPGLFTRARGLSAWGERVEIAADVHFPSYFPPDDYQQGALRERVALVPTGTGIQVVFATESGALRAWWKDELGTPHTSESFPPKVAGEASPCTPYSPIGAALDKDGRTVVSGVCIGAGDEERTVLATFDRKAGSWSWQIRPLEPYAFQIAPLPAAAGPTIFAEWLWAQGSSGWKRPLVGLSWAEGDGWGRATALEADDEFISFAAASDEAGDPAIALVRRQPSAEAVAPEIWWVRYRR